MEWEWQLQEECESGLKIMISDLDSQSPDLLQYHQERSSPEGVCAGQMKKLQVGVLK